MALTKVTAGVIAANAVVDSFGTQSITGDKIGLNAITGNTLASNIINSNNIVGGAVTGDKLGATSINANNIVGGTITTTQIASNTVSNTNIATGAVENYLRANALDFGMRNKIINGAMMFDQRNAGNSVTVTNAATTYTLDRWAFFENGSMVFSAQRSTTAPAGFRNSMLITTTTSTTAGPDDRSQVFQRIEGFNVADLAWGTANAKTVTLSFWIRSSLTGQFGGAIGNNNNDRSYPFSFTISSANTFEYKTITIPGDTTGTWLTDSDTGIVVYFDLGMGANLLGTAGAWAGADYRGATGDVKLSGTTNATLYLTGVQLEEGSTATSFEYRSYGTELQLCQRYFQVIGGGPPDSSAARNEIVATGMQFASTEAYYILRFIQEMRAVPTVTLVGNIRYYKNGTSATLTTAAFEGTSIRGTRIYLAISSGSAGDASWCQIGGFENDRITASAEL